MTRKIFFKRDYREISPLFLSGERPCTDFLIGLVIVIMNNIGTSPCNFGCRVINGNY